MYFIIHIPYGSAACQSGGRDGGLFPSSPEQLTDGTVIHRPPGACALPSQHACIAGAYRILAEGFGKCRADCMLNMQHVAVHLTLGLHLPSGFPLTDLYDHLFAHIYHISPTGAGHSTNIRYFKILQIHSVRYRRPLRRK